VPNPPDGAETPFPLRDPAPVVVAAYALAAISALVPLAVAGALFAGIALMRRNRRAEGMGVIVVGVVATALGVALR
jgi:hypothetical protein